MRAGSRKTVANAYWNDVIEMLTNNLLKELIVLREDFGFGEERLNKFLRGVCSRTKTFDDMEADGVLEIKTDYERRQYKKQITELVNQMAVLILPANIFEEIRLGTNSGTREEAQCYHACKERERNKVDTKSVAELHDLMQAVRDYDKQRHSD